MKSHRNRSGPVDLPLPPISNGRSGMEKLEAAGNTKGSSTMNHSYSSTNTQSGPSNSTYSHFRRRHKKDKGSSMLQGSSSLGKPYHKRSGKQKSRRNKHHSNSSSKKGYGAYGASIYKSSSNRRGGHPSHSFSVLGHGHKTHMRRGKQRHKGHSGYGNVGSLRRKVI